MNRKCRSLKTVHELRVHQIELEMQNEELRRAQIELDVSRERSFDLYDLAPVAYCTVNEHGLILEANIAAATLLGVARSSLVGQRISRFIVKAARTLITSTTSACSRRASRRPLSCKCQKAMTPISGST